MILSQQSGRIGVFLHFFRNFSLWNYSKGIYEETEARIAGRRIFVKDGFAALSSDYENPFFPRLRVLSVLLRIVTANFYVCERTRADLLR